MIANWKPRLGALNAQILQRIGRIRNPVLCCFASLIYIITLLAVMLLLAGLVLLIGMAPILIPLELWSWFTQRK